MARSCENPEWRVDAVLGFGSKVLVWGEGCELQGSRLKVHRLEIKVLGLQE